MTNLDRWIDPRVRLVTAANVHAYLKARGWHPRPSMRPQVLLFEEPAGHRGKPVVQVVPATDNVSDCTDALTRVITNLAAIEDRSATDVLDDILRQPKMEPNDAEPSVSSPRTRKH